MHRLPPVIMALLLSAPIHRIMAQSSEFRLGINKTHLYQTDNFNDGVYQKDGLGFGIQYRVQAWRPAPLLNHVELNLDLYRGNINIYQHRSPGGAGGNITLASLRTVSVGMNNYFVNFGTLHKPFQVALGLSLQYKLYNRSFGEYSEQRIGWDTTRNYYSFSWTYYDMDRKTGAFNPFTVGLCASIGFRSFKLGKREFRTRYDLWMGYTSENNKGLYFWMMNQRLSMGMVFGQVSDEYLKIRREKKQQRTDRRMKNTERLNRKPSITDKSLECGFGVNTFHLRTPGYYGTVSNTGAGFGFGFRIWEWPGEIRFPAITLNFQQVNYSVWENFLISPVGGTFRRNTLSAGIYPARMRFFKKRLDIRIGADIHVLVSNRAQGVYGIYDNNSGTLLQRTQFKTDIFNLHNTFSAGPVLSSALPLLRTNSYCLRWRNTFAWTMGDMTVQNGWSNSIRWQSEIACCFRWSDLQGLL